MKILWLAFLGLTFSFARGQTPVPSPAEIFQTVARLDTSIFETFNAHDAGRLMSFFTDDVEFYHDKDGQENHQEMAEGFKKLFATTPDIRRDLVPGSLEVYPLKDNGAIEVGAHRFTHRENGKEEVGTFKFVMIWRKDGDTWRISRVVSYGH